MVSLKVQQYHGSVVFCGTSQVQTLTFPIFLSLPFPLNCISLLYCSVSQFSAQVYEFSFSFEKKNVFIEAKLGLTVALLIGSSNLNKYTHRCIYGGGHNTGSYINYVTKFFIVLDPPPHPPRK